MLSVSVIQTILFKVRLLFAANKNVLPQRVLQMSSYQFTYSIQLRYFSEWNKNVVSYCTYMYGLNKLVGSQLMHNTIRSILKTRRIFYFTFDIMFFLEDETNENLPQTSFGAYSHCSYFRILKFIFFFFLWLKLTQRERSNKSWGF